MGGESNKSLEFSQNSTDMRSYSQQQCCPAPASVRLTMFPPPLLPVVILVNVRVCISLARLSMQ